MFVLPVLLIAYFCQDKRFSVLWFGLIPAVWVATGIPMALIGQSPWYAVQAYLGLTNYNLEPTLNCPNMFALLGDALGNDGMIQDMWQHYGLVLAVFALGGMAVWFIARRRRVSGRSLLLLGAWGGLGGIFFLPRMHERYGMAGEVLLILWAVQLWKPRGFLYAALGTLPTASAYCEYMFLSPMFSLQWGAALNLILLCLLTRELVRAANGDAPLPVEPLVAGGDAVGR
jgi:hypothetical protein